MLDNHRPTAPVQRGQHLLLAGRPDARVDLATTGVEDERGRGAQDAERRTTSWCCSVVDIDVRRTPGVNRDDLAERCGGVTRQGAQNAEENCSSVARSPAWWAHGVPSSSDGSDAPRRQYGSAGSVGSAWSVGPDTRRVPRKRPVVAARLQPEAAGDHEGGQQDPGSGGHAGHNDLGPPGIPPRRFEPVETLSRRRTAGSSSTLWPGCTSTVEGRRW